MVRVDRQGQCAECVANTIRRKFATGTYTDPDQFAYVNHRVMLEHVKSNIFCRLANRHRFSAVTFRATTNISLPVRATRKPPFMTCAIDVDSTFLYDLYTPPLHYHIVFGFALLLLLLLLCCMCRKPAESCPFCSTTTTIACVFPPGYHYLF